MKVIQEVLSVIPENVDARRNMARVYLDLSNREKPQNPCSSVYRSIPRMNGAR